MKRSKRFVGSLAGVGFLPGAPGTWGSFVSLLLLYPLALAAGTAGLILFMITASLLTLWSADACIEAWGEDPARVVMDEAAGQAAALLWIPFSGSIQSDAALLVAAFLLFRFFDVLKPLGIKQLQHFSSGFGILLDDVAAGFYALLCLHIGIFFISPL